MPDVVSPAVRSRMMAGIQGKNTRPELLLRRALHRKGFRYRIHVSGLPGKPDMVFPGKKAVILIHGCFWHGHDCHLFKWPSSRIEFWRTKIGQNKERDKRAVEQLTEAGWRILTVWECALKGRERRAQDTLIDTVEQWLTTESENIEIKGLPRARIS